MDESRYQRLAGDAFRRIEDAFAEVDPSDADLEAAGDVLTLTLKNKVRCIVNTQRPTKQIWLAASSRAWHFGLDEASGRWLDDKGTGAELFATIESIVKEHAAIDVKI
ncbi:MAG: iron donor protein CyaY [Polyangiales bacterium]